MFKGYKIVKESVLHYPLQLLELKDKKLIAYAESFLKYDTGFEIECNFKLDNTKDIINSVKRFKEIPNIVHVSCDSMEQRFRIPTGIKGLICLYETCKLLKQESALNVDSGIHYHIDFTKESYKNKYNEYWFRSNDFIKSNNDWILKALKSWNYKGKFNNWVCSKDKTAVKFHENYGTVEFRIGEMTFDYSLMIKRIIHCQNISTKIKENLVAYNKIKNAA